MFFWGVKQVSGPGPEQRESGKTYCKQVPKWDNEFWSADIYCQIVLIFYTERRSIYIKTERREKG